MGSSEDWRFLILDTSGPLGRVAVAQSERLLATRDLDQNRRHARDLAPSVAALLQEVGWQPRDVTGVIVSQGPGSYTGLRVGIMSAKAFAYATGAALFAVPTFEAIAFQVPETVMAVTVLADAQQERIYVQRFARPASATPIRPASALAIRSLVDWLGVLGETDWVTGPALRRYRERLPTGARIIEPSLWEPQPQSLLQLGLERYRRDEKADVILLEPIYLRPSSAEEKWDARLA